MNEEDELKREIKQLKEQNESLTKLLEKVYKKLGLNNEDLKLKENSKEKNAPKNAKQNEERTVTPKEEEIEIPIEGIDWEMGITRKGEAQDSSKDGKVEFNVDLGSNYFSKEIKQLLEGINNEIKSLTKKISNETEKIRITPIMTDENYKELMGKLESLRAKLKELRSEFKRAQKELWHATKEIAMTKRLYHKTRSFAKNSIEKLENFDILEKELQELRNVLENTKERLKDATVSYVRLLKRVQVMKKGSKKKKKAQIYISEDFNLGEVLSKYIGSIIGTTVKNLEEALKSVVPEELISLKLGESNALDLETKDIEGIIKIDEKNFPEFLERASLLFSALGDKNRLKLLKILEKGPEFQKELSEKTGLKGGTFKHHTDLLKETNLITREAVRGRYLITKLGFEAIKLAELLYSRYLDYIKEESDEEEDEK